MSGLSSELSEATDLALARGGDHEAFARLIAPRRGELHAHCYRILGSAHDADDALQEALLRAWRGLGGFSGHGSLRSWLYTVATRTCLDALAGRRRRALPVDLSPSSDRVVADDGPATEVEWLGPYPGSRLVDGHADPGVRYEQREAVELAFVAALQHLPGNQRAALVLFEVLGFSAGEIAAMMRTSTASVNSALQRARTVVSTRIPERTQQKTLRALGDVRLTEVVAAYSSALQRGDAESLAALLTEDVTWSMPPRPHWYRGLETVMDFVKTVPLTSCGSWRHRSLTANGQPAVATYLAAQPDAPHSAWSIDVLTLRGDRIAAVTSFLGVDHFRLFDLPEVLA